MIRSRSSAAGKGDPEFTEADLPGLKGRGFALLILATAAGLCGFAAVLPLVPLWASRGGAGEFGAGATTAAFMLTTVITQLAMPWLLDHAGGYQWAFPVGSLIMGLPMPLFALTTDLGPLVAISAVRGVGFGMVTVAGTALAARLVAKEQVGRATGYYGLAVGLPQIVILPGGVALALSIGFDTAFWLTGICGVLAAALASGIWFADGGRNRAALRGAAPDDGKGAVEAPSAPRGLPLLTALAAPLIIMLVVSSAASAVVTFLAIPLEQAAWLVSALLAAYALMLVTGRWTAGVLYDRHRRTVLLLPGTLAAVAGMGLLTAGLWANGDGSPGAGVALLVLGGTALFGLGFGAVQNEAVTMMLERAGPTGYGRASAWWNIGYDAGTGVGAIGLGLVIQLMGYGPAFAIVAVSLAAVLPLALRRK
ncbi:MFS transporter [Nocardiopsis valliformis]|uniref:MFS transporter n=1 Tax=Nocardiopsis valliformis TaxID=239974 RepID=UPI000347BCAF|nr:MFS transporter [Nocardiopsis valliformis]